MTHLQLQIGKYYKLFEHNEFSIFPSPTHHLSCHRMDSTMVNILHVHSILHIRWFLSILNIILFDVLKSAIEITLKRNIPIFFLFAWHHPDVKKIKCLFNGAHTITPLYYYDHLCACPDNPSCWSYFFFRFNKICCIDFNLLF